MKGSSCRRVAAELSRLSRSLLVVVLALACRDSAPSHSGPDSSAQPRVAATTFGPVVTVVDSIVLQEASNSPMGGFTTFWGISAHGRILISDISNRRVMVFDRDGSALRTIGAGGSGPGEFEAPAALLTGLDDDQVGVLDFNRSRMLIFEVESGSFVREIVTPIQHIGTSTVRDGETIVVAPVRGAAPLVRWNLSTDRFEPLGTTNPSVIAGSQSVIMSSGVPGVVQHGDGWLLWEPGYGLSLYQADGSNPRPLTLPAARRRGEGRTMVQRQMDLIRDQKLEVTLSAAVGAGSLAGGNIVLASGDYDLIGEDLRSARPGNQRVYLTVLDATLEKACVDGLVPLESDVPVAPLFRGDTVSVLTRVVTDEGTVRSVVYRLLIDLDKCEWVPVGS